MRGGEAGEGVARAAFFEGAGRLKVVVFHDDPHARLFAEARRGRARSDADAVRHAGVRAEDVVEGEQVWVHRRKGRKMRTIKSPGLEGPGLVEVRVVQKVKTAFTRGVQARAGGE
jgi:hypothetical protein